MTWEAWLTVSSQIIGLAGGYPWLVLLFLALTVTITPLVWPF